MSCVLVSLVQTVFADDVIMQKRVSYDILPIILWYYCQFLTNIIFSLDIYDIFINDFTEYYLFCTYIPTYKLHNILLL